MIPETATAALALNPFEKFAQTTKRDERDPYVMFNFDRMINFAARVSAKNRKKILVFGQLRQKTPFLQPFRYLAWL